MLTVVKVGGAVAGAPSELAELASAVAGLAGARVVVHGGGAEITAWQERLGLEVVRRDFAAGHTLRLGGWLLSRTEARMAALAALAGRATGPS